MKLRRMVPWWARIGLKIVLARIAIPYRWWKRFGLFEHGNMDRPAAALATVLQHARTAELLIDDELDRPRFRNDLAVLEIGPGDSLGTGIICHVLGARHSILVDAGAFATRDGSHYRAILSCLAARGYAIPAVSFVDDPTPLLDACAVRYLTGGIGSLATLPSASIDFCFSNAVLEHIPNAEFTLFAREMMRVLKPQGVAVHRVDFKDHLGGGLNNLRFSNKLWEGPLFIRSGFYTNRIRPGAMRQLFESAGLVCEVTRIETWPSVPIDRRSMDVQFRQLPEEELRVSGMDFRLSPGPLPRRRDHDV